MSDPGQTAIHYLGRSQKLFFLRHLAGSIVQTVNLVQLHEIEIEDIRVVCGPAMADYISLMVYPVDPATGEQTMTTGLECPRCGGWGRRSGTDETTCEKCNGTGNPAATGQEISKAIDEFNAVGGATNPPQHG